MQIEIMVRQLLKGKIVPAVGSILLGIALVFARRSGFDLLVRIAGWLFIAGGVGYMLNYLFRKDREGYTIGMALSAALMAVVIGALLVYYAEDVVNFFPILMGLALVLNGLSNLTAARFYLGSRVIISLMSLLLIVCGVLVMTHPGNMVNALAVYMGIFLVINGIFDLFMLWKIREELLK